MTSKEFLSIFDENVVRETVWIVDEITDEEGFKISNYDLMLAMSICDKYKKEISKKALRRVAALYYIMKEFSVTGNKEKSEYGEFYWKKVLAQAIYVAYKSREIC